MRLGELLPLIRQGSEGRLVGGPELFGALLQVNARLGGQSLSGLQLGLPGTVQGQKPAQKLLLLGLATAAGRVDELQPDGGEDFPIEDLSLRGRP